MIAAGVISTCTKDPLEKRLQVIAEAACSHRAAPPGGCRR